MERNEEQIKEHEARVKKQKLDEILNAIPDDKKHIAQGLIVQAARMSILLDDAWLDIQETLLTKK
ncbi:TPA: hypothetical protein NJP70_002793 [Staphylococcus aureus]|uniref:hypothetical protein n=1 Tax=Staphylococcus aureus TaxID=1280 RepID=UPI00091B5F9D|nr:hypothetical protein [Staphylococcus aureus]MBS3285582.1 hypothetical protein [Staphylococcus aureus]MBS3293553.1 hypothetical protein [Staphylococcus aureus]MBS3304214.1 hypothetical protein [Staphylococcus aureus]MBS3339152.1 hypothetical protein [Staphylococcus aureus]MBS3341681.1 hypothetical protein [Staphylococcus aureus]